MEDSRLTHSSAQARSGAAARLQQPVRPSSRRLSTVVWVVAVTAMVTGASGCSLFVMAGKMFFGDPMVQCTFTKNTGVDLVKDDARIVVLCSIPEFVRSELPSLDTDLIDAMSVQLRRNRVDVVRQDDVANWIEDRGGFFGEAHEIASQVALDLDSDYIVHVDIHNFSIREENSEGMFRGSAVAVVTAFAAVDVDGMKQALQVFTTEFTSAYPAHHPVSTESMSERSFRKRYSDRIGLQLAQIFYNHRFAEELD